MPTVWDFFWRKLKVTDTFRNNQGNKWKIMSINFDEGSRCQRVITVYAIIKTIKGLNGETIVKTHAILC
jgi:hypothetical protein